MVEDLDFLKLTCFLRVQVHPQELTEQLEELFALLSFAICDRHVAEHDAEEVDDGFLFEALTAQGLTDRSD